MMKKHLTTVYSIHMYIKCSLYMLKLYLRMYVFRGSMAKTKSIKNDKRFKIYDQVITFFKRYKYYKSRKAH